MKALPRDRHPDLQELKFIDLTYKALSHLATDERERRLNHIILLTHNRLGVYISGTRVTSLTLYEDSDLFLCQLDDPGVGCQQQRRSGN